MTRYDSLNDLPPHLREQAYEQLNGRITKPRAVTVQDVDARPKQSKLEAMMEATINTLASQDREYLNEYETEYRFHPTRRWRFDFAWPEMMVAVEVEGGQWSNGRHQRGKGYEADAEKYNHAAALGWKVFRFTTDMIRRNDALSFLGELFPPF